MNSSQNLAWQRRSYILFWPPSSHIYTVDVDIGSKESQLNWFHNPSSLTRDIRWGDKPKPLMQASVMWKREHPPRARKRLKIMAGSSKKKTSGRFNEIPWYRDTFVVATRLCLVPSPPSPISQIPKSLNPGLREPSGRYGSCGRKTVEDDTWSSPSPSDHIPALKTSVGGTLIPFPLSFGALAVHFTYNLHSQKMKTQLHPRKHMDQMFPFHILCATNAPARARIKVVLPAPDGPKIMRRSPSLIWNDKSR